MIWQKAHRADKRCLPLADRHYNRQKIGSPQFVPPGSCFVLYAKTFTGEALWVTSAPIAKYVKHAWAGAWVNSCFRNEKAATASELIRQALAASRWYYGNPPELGLITFIDSRFVKPVIQRGIPTVGFCYIKAGAKFVGMTKGGLHAFQFTPDVFPVACEPLP